MENYSSPGGVVGVLSDVWSPTTKNAKCEGRQNDAFPIWVVVRYLTCDSGKKRREQDECKEYKKTTSAVY